MTDIPLASVFASGARKEAGRRCGRWRNIRVAVGLIPQTPLAVLLLLAPSLCKGAREK